MCQFTWFRYVVYSLGSFVLYSIYSYGSSWHKNIYCRVVSDAKKSTKEKGYCPSWKTARPNWKEDGQKTSTSTTSVRGSAYDDLYTSSHEEISEYPAHLCISTTNDTACWNVPSDCNILLQGMTLQNKVHRWARAPASDDTDSAGDTFTPPPTCHVYEQT